MQSRPYFDKSTAEIEELYNINVNKMAVLKDLLLELQHRDKPKAMHLREEIATAIDKCRLSTPFSSNTPKPTTSMPQFQLELQSVSPTMLQSESEPYVAASPSESQQQPVALSSTAQPQPDTAPVPQPKPPSPPVAASVPTPLDKARAHVVNVIEYLSALARVNSVVVRDIDNYQNIFWFSDIPRNGTNCYSRTWGAEENTPDDIWLEVKKMPEAALPPVPKICDQWVIESQLRKFDSLPSLQQSITITTKVIDPATGEQHETIETKRLSDNPAVQTSWDAYVQQKWQPWVVIYKKYLEIQKVFGALYGIYQEQQRFGEQYELIVGLGLLTWRQPKGQSVRRHLVVAKASLEFEAAIGRFVVKPAPDGDQAEVELDMLESDCFPANASSLVAAGRQLRDNFWDRTTSNSILSSISNSLEEQGRGIYNADAERPCGANTTEVPLIEFAPALILRKRSQKGLLNILADMRRQVESGMEIPVQFLDLCEAADPADLQGEICEHDTPHEQTPYVHDHIYFPLQANEQQRQIIYKFNKQRGVLVQGPPGTGKSQTITNLICHLLATGQRVLVTAKTTRALEVLHEKIPPAVSPLCISMLGSGTDERESMERSVNGILNNINSRNIPATARKMEELEQKLHDSKKAKAEAEYALVALRERETFQHSIAGGTYTGTAAAIASSLLTDEPVYNWLTDEITETDDAPLSRSEIDELSVLLLDISNEMEVELSKYFPDPNKDLPDCEYLRGLWQQLTDYELLAKDSEGRLRSLSGQAIAKSDREQILALHDAMNHLVAEIHSVNRRSQSWVGGAVKDVLADLDTPWKQLHKLTTDRLENLKKMADKTQSCVVEIPSGIDQMRLSGDAKSLLTHFTSGGGLKQFGLFEHPMVKKHGEMLRQVRLNGQECLNKDLLPDLIDYLSVKFLLAEIWSLWAGKASSQPEIHPLMQIAEIEELIEALDNVLDLYSKRADVISAVVAIPGLPRPQFEDVDSLVELIKTCQNVLEQAELKQLKQQVLKEDGRVMSAVSRANGHPLCSEIYHAVKDHDPDRYCKAVNSLQGLSTQHARVVTKKKFLNVLASKTPRFASTLSSPHSKQLAVQQLEKLDKAWAWRQATDWMVKFQRQDGSVLERNIRQYELTYSKALEELAALKAWTHCFARMTREHQQHLVSWHQSMRRLGKGTGKHAHKHRLDAQRSLNECKGAVPAWIMPLHRIYETVEAAPGCFDVVIVDEASQCGFEGLPLLYLAKKIIVVGDEKQISPEAVGTDRTHVFNLMKAHLSDFKHSASFDIENSLFAHGQIRFGNKITLCEHFRCAPEIIRFSNELCYTSDPLIPLKQVPPNRLVPLKAVHVPSGYREGSGQTIVNRPEAEAIVKQIIACCKDNCYDGMTMGVIVLQGDAQSKVIEDMLVRQLGTEEMQERRLLCGNPYSFQGDERDVIFMSMVAATNERIGALVQEKDTRRFNVAASRAREQMWLFHSVTSNDLSNRCLRKRLLNHFYDTTAPPTVGGISVEDLRQAAHVADRWREESPAPFDSWFEVDVALQIAGRGYTVVPQFEFAGKKIDLVVQGGSAQLAVECDGDHWHGRDKFEDDMQRQRMLERCNWVFFRVRESNYRIDNEKALEQLWGMLEARGIYPQGGEQHTNSPNEAAEEPIDDSTESNPQDIDDVDLESDDEGEIDDSDEIISGGPLSIQKVLNLKPVELRKLILEAFKTLPNNSCVRKALTTIILKKCCILTRGTPRKVFERKVEHQVAAMIRDGHLIAYRSKNERLKLGWVFTTNGQG
ncbi:AAA domain-containing protein [Oryzomonas rubra]|uniref:DNA helicase n=1 Tax=Oryzomonas rubra TaxID=2509454 RepID=A0A5A9XMU4_9BACT|nr:AAA domain-containing protein [Oryzomonas rubra]KAA0894170.1 DNA helicase [Oryzomonas rubra]